MSVDWRALRDDLEQGATIDDDTALAVLHTPPGEIPELLAVATWVRRRHFGDRVTACSIVNARSGACGEDCAFCAQSAAHQTGTAVYPLLDNDRLVAAYRDAVRHPISHFGVVTSGGALGAADVQRVAAAAVAAGEEKGVHWCASLGALPPERLRQLAASGVRRYHHNIETAPNYFPAICSTHTFAERLQTVRAARAAGLEVCCGGILGMGETLPDRVSMARLLAEEKVDSIPLNFLMPIAGTRLEALAPMPPLEILRAVAMFRLVCPPAEIKVCAGRLLLRDLQALVFYAGATGIMIGDLLTVAGRNPQDDRRMLQDLEVLDG